MDEARADALGLQAPVVVALVVVVVASASGSWGLRWPRREMCGYLQWRRRFAHCVHVLSSPPSFLGWHAILRPLQK